MMEDTRQAEERRRLIAQAAREELRRREREDARIRGARALSLADSGGVRAMKLAQEEAARRKKFDAAMWAATHPEVWLPRRWSLATAGSGGGEPDHPLKVKDASESGILKVRVVSGMLYGSTPTIGGVSIAADPAPELSVSGPGWVVLKTYWASDYVPRSIPLSSEFVFESGDPTGTYSPSTPDSQTAASMAHARVFVDTSGTPFISDLQTIPSGNIVCVRQVYDSSTFQFVAGKL